MVVFENPDYSDHERVVFGHDKGTGLKAIIAIHDTTLGPAMGGCRMWPYASEDAALSDALRLSRGMTYKNALAGLDFGGGKAVIIGDPKRDKSTALFEAFGRFVDSLAGRYLSAEDVGISPGDVEIMHRQTAHVIGIARDNMTDGDPSPATAWGVFHGLAAAVRHRMARTSLDGLRVAVQGAGHVGYHLMRHLDEAGAKLLVSDIDPALVARAVREFGAEAVPVDAIYDVSADVFAPCALGAVINDDTLGRLKVQVVAGSANNQLEQDRHGGDLGRRGILYAPDYVINAGGVIHISHEGPAYQRQAAYDHCARLYDVLADLFRRAERAGVATNVMADRMAEERLEQARQRAEHSDLKMAS